jgi:Ca-activated chloride channel homolog
MKRMKSLAAFIAFLSLASAAPAGVLYSRLPGTETPVYSLRISKIRTSVTIAGRLAVTHVDEEFYNDNNLRLEGFYAFQLPEGARMDGLWLWENGVRKIFICMKKEEAERRYDSVVSRTRRDPAILESLGQNRFQLKIFPIEPRSYRRVEIQYFHTLPLLEDGYVHYRYPLNISGYQTQPVEQTDMRISVASAQRILDFRTSFDSLPLLNRVTKVNDNRYDIMFGLENMHYGVDYEIRWQPEGILDVFPALSWKDPASPSEDPYFITWHAWRDDSTGTSIKPRDLVFVLDASGSMDGARLTAVRDAVTQVLSRLSAYDRFRIVLFGTDAIAFPAGRAFLPATPDSIAKAAEFIRRMYISGGGTNYEQAFIKAFDADFDPAADRRMLFLTDGEPTMGKTTASELLAVIAANDISSVRIYPVLFYTSTIQLLYEIASARGGKAQNVEPGDNLSTVISRLMLDLDISAVRSAAISYLEGKTYLVSPLTFPPVTTSDQLITTGRWTGDGLERVKLTYLTSNGNPAEFIRAVDFNACGTNLKEVACYWAGKRIDQLLEEIKQFGETPELKKSIIDLSVKYGVLSPYTAFLVLETNPVDPNGIDGPVPDRIAIGAPYPNPFHAASGGALSVPVEVSGAQSLRVVITDALGRVVKTLEVTRTDAGRFIISWDGRNEAGHVAAAGTYFIRFHAGVRVVALRMVAIR